MDSIASSFGGLFESILPAFQNPVFAYEVALIGILIAALLISLAALRAVGALARVRHRYRLIERTLQSSSTSPRVAFAQNWQEIDTAMLGGGGPARSGTE